MSASQKLDRGETMAVMWDGFKAATIPPDAPPIQSREMRNAFYAGALCLFNWFMVQMEPGDDEPTDADLAKVTLMDEELRAYFATQERRL
jgi:hypothetical protein